MAQSTLKLRARGTADIMTLSGLVQDALIAPEEMTVEHDKRRFIAILNRYMWERDSQDQLAALPAQQPASPTHASEDARFEDASDGRFWRTQCALVIERANAIKAKNFNARKPHRADDQGGGPVGGLASDQEGRFHYLLSIVPDEGGVNLFFAGGGVLRAEGPALELFVEDLGEPWPTPERPSHDD